MSDYTIEVGHCRLASFVLSRVETLLISVIFSCTSLCWDNIFLNRECVWSATVQHPGARVT